VKKIIIAIDGFSSCGKSTVAKALAKELGYQYIDSGAMYRAVALYFLRNNIPFLPENRDMGRIEEALENIRIDFRLNPELGLQETFLNGENVEKEIRQMFVAGHVSKVSTISAVRRFLVRQQQARGPGKGIVMDGRDIGTVVFPEAELKLFMTAGLHIRAQRRLEEMKSKGQEADYKEVLANLEERDHIDSTREDSPLRKAEDAIVIDNSHLDPDCQLELALKYARERIGSFN
jgi:cytidylate kinase